MMTNHITEKLDNHTISSGRRFVFLWDRAFFTLQFFAGDRASPFTPVFISGVEEVV